MNRLVYSIQTISIFRDFSLRRKNVKTLIWLMALFEMTERVCFNS
jgi:hypothetical protein